MSLNQIDVPSCHRDQENMTLHNTIGIIITQKSKNHMYATWEEKRHFISLFKHISDDWEDK